jgi:hypothetical protein
MFPRRVQLPIPLGLNLRLMPGEHVLWRDVADGTVQPGVVVMREILPQQSRSLLHSTGEVESASVQE